MGRGDQNEFVIFGELLVLLLFASRLLAGESTDVSGAKESPFLSLLSLSSKSQMSPDCRCVSLESSD